MTQLRLSPAPLPQEPARAGSQVTHFVTVPEYLDPSDLEFLFQCREPRAAWETLPTELVDGNIVEILPGTIRLSPHAVVHGPYSPFVLAPDASREVIELSTGAVSMGESGVILDTGMLRLDQDALNAEPETLPHPAGFPASASLVWALTCTKARGEKPFQGGGDRDGLSRAFAEGFPLRDEGRQAISLVAVARYLGGTVHFDAVDSQPMRSYRPELDHTRYRSVAPESAANVDLTVYSDVWLDPQAALRLAQLAAPEMTYLPTHVEWDGPAELAESDPFAEVVTHAQSVLEPEMVNAIQVHADHFDAQALSQPAELTAYGLVQEGPRGSVIALDVAGTSELPAILTNVEWASQGVVEYRISWTPQDLEDWQKEIPSFELRQQRTRATATVKALAKSIYSATAGEVIDQDGFLRDPASL